MTATFGIDKIFVWLYGPEATVYSSILNATILSTANEHMYFISNE